METLLNRTVYKKTHEKNKGHAIHKRLVTLQNNLETIYELWRRQTKMANVILSKTSVVLLFITGIIVGLFPSVYFIWQHSLPRSNPYIPASAAQVDIRSLIHVNSQIDLEKKRQELIHIIWGNNYQPDKQPFSVTENIQDERLDQLNGIRRVDRLEIHMQHGINSTAYLFNPQSSRPLAIYYQGHDGDFFIGKTTIQSFIDKGLVLAFSMPLTGDNNRPTVAIAGIGPVKLTAHDQLKFVENPLLYFTEPVLEGLNYVQDHYQPEQVIMIGYSGGGWSTTIYAAVDTRIDLSFPVAGSLPIFLRNGNDWGDFEQTFPDLYEKVNYLDLYIMGSSGQNRRQLQILNEFDSCCFAGTRHTFYEKEIAEISTRLGGAFSVYLDGSHKSHKISPTALERIFREIDYASLDHPYGEESINQD